MRLLVGLMEGSFQGYKVHLGVNHPRLPGVALELRRKSIPHFGQYFNKRVERILVMTPADNLARILR